MTPILFVACTVFMISWWGLGIFLFDTVSRPALGPT